MRRSILAVALAGTALVSLPFEGSAQVRRSKGPTSTAVKPVQFGVAAGAALPVSNLGDFFNTGFNGTITVALHPQLIPLGIRIDGAYNQFGLKRGGGNVHFTSVTGNLVYQIPSDAVSPYLIGGPGWYNTAGSGGGGSSNDFGWNIGGGIKMPLSGFDTFLEARYNQIQTSGTTTKFIPITFGVMF